jgi:pyruvate dehydrogenase (quinone)
MVDADPVNPMRIVWELNERLPLNAIVTSDSGSSANWYGRLLRVRGEVRGSLSGTLASMGAAVPYAIGAKFAHPDRPAIALTGDGAMQMNGWPSCSPSPATPTAGPTRARDHASCTTTT